MRARWVPYRWGEKAAVGQQLRVPCGGIKLVLLLKSAYVNGSISPVRLPPATLKTAPS